MRVTAVDIMSNTEHQYPLRFPVNESKFSIDK